MSDKIASEGAGGKPRLIPLRVPWMVSPSTPFLRVACAESELPTQITFCAYFGSHVQGVRAEGGPYTSVQMVGAPYDEAGRQPDASATYQVVIMTFERGLFVRFYPSFDNGAAFEREFDWSALPSDADWDSFDPRWRESGNCPDPGCYEVESSIWLRDAGPEASDSKHFIVVGHDANVEVLAEGWSWKAGVALPDW